MTPRIPKIRVRPLATRKSTRPYCTPFRSCTANVTKSIAAFPRETWRGGRETATAEQVLGDAAAARGIVHVGLRDRDELVSSVAHLAQIDVLDRIVRLVEAQRPTGAIDL